jgi:hypothetical protein
MARVATDLLKSLGLFISATTARYDLGRDCKYKVINAFETNSDYSQEWLHKQKLICKDDRKCQKHRQESRRNDLRMLTMAKKASLNDGLLKARSSLSKGPGGAIGGRSETPTEMVTVKTAAKMLTSPTQPENDLISHMHRLYYCILWHSPNQEIPRNVRIEATIVAAMAATSVNLYTYFSL